MATFAYSGRTRAGQTVNGEREADSMDAAVAALRREQVLVTKINPAKDEQAAKAPKAKVAQGQEACRPKSLAVFTRQFSVMIDAGLPLVQCLEILGTQEEDKNFGRVILETRAEVENGASLADAMRKNPKVFDALFTNMIAAGEAGGILDTILKRLATYIEKAVKLKNQVQSAMIYPVAIIVIAGRGRRRHSVEGHPDVRDAVRRPGRRSAAAHAHRHRAQQRPGALHAVRARRASAPSCSAFRAYYNTAGGRMTIDGIMLKMPVLGPDDAQDRRGPVLPHAGDAAGLRRLDSRGAGHHGPHRRQRRGRARAQPDAQEHRGRRDDRRAAARRPACSRRWWCR